VNFGVITMRAMTEVQPKRVNAREKERFQHFGRSTSRTDCSNDFGSAIAAHCSFGLSAASGNQNGSDMLTLVPVGTRPDWHRTFGAIPTAASF